MLSAPHAGTESWGGVSPAGIPDWGYRGLLWTNGSVVLNLQLACTSSLAAITVKVGIGAHTKQKTKYSMAPGKNQDNKWRYFEIKLVKEKHPANCTALYLPAQSPLWSLKCYSKQSKLREYRRRSAAHLPNILAWPISLHSPPLSWDAHCNL